MVWASWSLEGWQKRCGGGWLAASLSYPLTFTFFTFPFLLFFFICDFFQPVIGLPIGNVQVEELVMTCSISNFLTTLPTSSLTTNYSAARCLAASFNLSTFNLSKVLAFEQIWEIANWRLSSATSSIASLASSFSLRWLATSSMITGALPGLSIPFLICISGKSHSQADSARHWPKVADTYWLCSCWYRTDPVSPWLSVLATFTLGDEMNTESYRIKNEPRNVLIWTLGP